MYPMELGMGIEPRTKSDVSDFHAFPAATLSFFFFKGVSG